MGKIAKTSTISLTRAGVARLDISDLLKFKGPDKKAAEVPATTLGDTAKRRLPGKPDFDGASFSVMAPNLALHAAANSPGCVAIATVNTDGSKGYWGIMGYLTTSPGEIDAEGDTIPTIDCSIVADGQPSTVAIYGPALAAGSAATTSGLSLDGYYVATAILSAPAIAQTTIALSGHSITVAAGHLTGSATIQLDAVASTLAATKTAGTIPTGASFAVSLAAAPLPS
jgi:hypothetical protein